MNLEGFWRYASLKLTIFGVPLPMFFIYFSWFRFPSTTTIYVCSFIVAIYAILNFFGITLKFAIDRIIYLFKGSIISGRPWWFRRFYE